MCFTNRRNREGVSSPNRMTATSAGNGAAISTSNALSKAFDEDDDDDESAASSSSSDNDSSDAAVADFLDGEDCMADLPDTDPDHGPMTIDTRLASNKSFAGRRTLLEVGNALEKVKAGAEDVEDYVAFKKSGLSAKEVEGLGESIARSSGKSESRKSEHGIMNEQELHSSMQKGLQRHGKFKAVGKRFAPEIAAGEENGGDAGGGNGARAKRRAACVVEVGDAEHSYASC